MMFDGEMSRWTSRSGWPPLSLALCACSSPSATLLTMRAAIGQGRAGWPGQGRLAGLARPIEHVLDGDAVDVLERQEVVAVDLAEVEDVHDVGVREPRRDARLVEKHVDEGLVVGILGEVRQDALDHALLLEPRRAEVAGEKHVGHASGGQVRQQRVLAEATGKSRFYRLTLTGLAGLIRRAHGCSKDSGGRPR
jgi:hypothetical protein